MLLHEPDHVLHAVRGLGRDHRVALALDDVLEVAVGRLVVQERVRAQPVVVVDLAQVSRP